MDWKTIRNLEFYTTLSDDAKSALAGLISAAFEGGSNYWYGSLRLDAAPDGKTKRDYECWYADVPLDEGGCVSFADLEEPDDSADEDGLYRLDYAKVLLGIQVMKEFYPQHWEDFINENWDANTADAFLQCCVFKSVIYG